MIKKYIQKLAMISFAALIIGVNIGLASPVLTSAAPSPIFAVDSCGTSVECKDVYTKYINPFVRLLSAAVGVVVVLMIIVGGIQYSSAGSDPQKVAEARKKMSNAVLALFSYLFLFAFLNWLVPGGIV